MVDIIDLMVDFVIIVLAAVIGFAIFYATNTTGWNATVVTIWSLLPLAFIGIGILALIIKLKYMKK
jgi:peptidoglycan/LPS O-acetylase OafA/YrhL